MNKIWLISITLPLLFSCGNQEESQSKEILQAIGLLKASHHLYDSLSQIRDETKLSQVPVQDSLSLANWQAWQSEFEQWQ